MRSHSALLFRVALTIAVCAALSVGCSSKKKATGMTSGIGDGGMDAGASDAGPPKKHKDAGHASMDAGTDGAAVDAGMAPYKDAGTSVCFGCDAGGAPKGWTCPKSFWADSICDCSCGAFDIDCHGNSCDTTGCWNMACDACFTDTLAWKPCAADPDPNDWSCDPSALVNGQCDCGCTVPDPECKGSGCTEPGCYRAKCVYRHDKTGADLGSSGPPQTWTCPKGQYGGGDGCDCGCGAVDPDCAIGVSVCTTPGCVANECEHCHDKDGRTLPGCDIALDPTNNNGWKCREMLHFNSGDGCDCGCGVADPDCNGNGCSGYACTNTSMCARCTDSAFPADELVGCVPASGGWTCDKHHYGTHDGCDCGCGIHDPDCGPAADGCETPSCKDDGKCDYCHSGSTESDYVQCKPTPTTGWSCGDETQPQWANAECDCGCGKKDPECRRENRASCTGPGCQEPTCTFCNDKNGVRAACPAPNWLNQGTCTNAVYGSDGLCDCGCGAIDPDCATGEGCAEPGCGANGCDVCHFGGTGVMMKCQYWTCQQADFSNGKCDCGCGGDDPECSGNGCLEPGCKAVACEVWHDPYGRVVHSP